MVVKVWEGQASSEGGLSMVVMQDGARRGRSTLTKKERQSSESGGRVRRGVHSGRQDRIFMV